MSGVGRKDEEEKANREQVKSPAPPTTVPASVSLYVGVGARGGGEGEGKKRRHGSRRGIGKDREKKRKKGSREHEAKRGNRRESEDKRRRDEGRRRGKSKSRTTHGGPPGAAFVDARDTAGHRQRQRLRHTRTIAERTNTPGNTRASLPSCLGTPGRHPRLLSSHPSQNTQGKRINDNVCCELKITQLCSLNGFFPFHSWQ